MKKVLKTREKTILELRFGLGGKKPKTQNEIANILIAMDEEIEALEAERKKMIQIREGVMDDLLTGRVRLKI
jgi:type I restriction enzyme S subunit